MSTENTTPNVTMPNVTTISEQPLKANQANAQHSTGPKAEEGKARSAMNARRHDLTGQFYVMNDLDRAAYKAFGKGMLQSLAPVGPYESQLAI